MSVSRILREKPIKAPGWEWACPARKRAGGDQLSNSELGGSAQAFAHLRGKAGPRLFRGGRK